MALSTGSRLGPYEILSPLGASRIKLLRRWFLLNALHEDPRWADLERRIAAAGPPR